ncbi:hypothetical protein OG711_07385 [Streptomyces uncialis]|uniref:hypothetical protein n=1 Tax=Streptomyces uncialis TaxID=1048205 RepID=UPI002E34C037|nr:hypothetical protein [Streptomyces uncialis]
MLGPGAVRTRTRTRSGTGGRRAHGARAPFQLRQPGPQFTAARGGAFMVVLGPGQIAAVLVGLLGGGGGADQPSELQSALRRVPLLPEHHAEPFAEHVTAAGAGVEDTQ